ncbi:M1 family metallopeptidase [Olleya sp. R77988]|uniref:M1 family metallopeptidase n=1 Tax=Olleya sp. R77988 TaxID=3093875 RepID=UPI0037C832CB
MKHIQFLLFAFLCFSVNAQQTDVVDFKTAKASLYIDIEKGEVTGSIEYVFDVLKETDSIYLDSPNIVYDYIEVNNSVNLEINAGEIILDGVVKRKFAKSKDNVMIVKYHVKPKKALYFINDSKNIQAWTQGQGKYTSHWLPSIDDMNDKIEFDLSFIVDSNYQVISNGKVLKVEKAKGYNTWYFDMQKPMSSYLVALAIGKYDKQVITSKSGIPIELYYYPEDSAKVEPTYRYTKQMFDFLEEEIGVPYPWQNYKQVPVKDFLYSGMENTSCTIFSDDFMIDDTSFVDKNYVNVNAHELAHQWFGDLVTETSGTHHWLQEGFATYYALLAERDIFGDEYYYWRLYEYAEELIAQEEASQSTSLLDPKSSSTTFYKKGAWVLHMLREQVGNKAFKTAVKNYLEKNAYKNVETSDFISEVEATSGQDLTGFVDLWLHSKIVPYNKMITHLSSVSDAVNGYLQIDCEGYSSKCSEYLTSNLFDNSKIKVIAQMPNKIQTKDFKNSIKVRQAIAQYVTKIPSALQLDYETLLQDKSYATIEAALYNLWANFPRKRKQYLDQTKSIYGFNNYNVRTLWLVLAIATTDYQEDKTETFYNELVGYTASTNPFSRRQNAFDSLSSLGLFNKEALKNLIEASKHHNWRFKSFAKQLLESLSENEKYKSIISNLQNNQKQ